MVSSIRNTTQQGQSGRSVALKRLLLAASVAVLPSLGSSAFAQDSVDTKADDPIDSIFVIGERRAYQGAFDPQEVPFADQIVDAELLREVGALNLNDALDLSASVARQNNFGGLWNAFSIRGFYGDINLPSGFSRQWF